jgi:hypothetical protein
MDPRIPADAYTDPYPVPSADDMLHSNNDLGFNDLGFESSLFPNAQAIPQNFDFEINTFMDKYGASSTSLPLTGTSASQSDYNVPIQSHPPNQLFTMQMNLPQTDTTWTSTPPMTNVSIPRDLTKTTLPAYYPQWGGIYQDILTLALAIAYTTPCQLWHPDEIPGNPQSRGNDIIAHPLYQIASSAVEIKIKVDSNVVEVPAHGGKSPVHILHVSKLIEAEDNLSLPELVTRWITWDLIQDRDEITNMTTAATLQYGFRNIDTAHSSGPSLEASRDLTDQMRYSPLPMDPVGVRTGLGPSVSSSSPPAISVADNINTYNMTDTEDRFLHVWQVSRKMVR